MHISDAFRAIAESELKIRDAIIKMVPSVEHKRIMWATFFQYGFPRDDWAEIMAMPEEQQYLVRDMYLLFIAEAETEYNIDVFVVVPTAPVSWTSICDFDDSKMRQLTRELGLSSFSSPQEISEKLPGIPIESPLTGFKRLCIVDGIPSYKR